MAMVKYTITMIVRIIRGSVRRSAQHSFADAALLFRGIGDFFDRVLRSLRASQSSARHVHAPASRAGFEAVKCRPERGCAASEYCAGEVFCSVDLYNQFVASAQAGGLRAASRRDFGDEQARAGAACQAEAVIGAGLIPATQPQPRPRKKVVVGQFVHAANVAAEKFFEWLSRQFLLSSRGCRRSRCRSARASRIPRSSRASRRRAISCCPCRRESRCRAARPRICPLL